MNALTFTEFRYSGKMGKGFQSRRKQVKRLEAEARNSRTTHHRTKQHRLRCSGFGPVG